MAGIATATQAQTQTARDAVYKAGLLLQQVSQGPLPAPEGLNSAQITLIDTALTAASTALTAIANSSAE